MIRLCKPLIKENSLLTYNKILKSGYIVQGKYVKNFEKKLQKYLNINNAILVSSGTAALHLALIVLGVKKGDEVIIPSFSYIATANVVEIVGAKPIFIDISLKDYCLDPNKIQKSISSKTKAIMPVHEFGYPAEIKSILKIAKNNNLYLIEDSACGLGSSYNNKKLGTFGNIGCFSFHPRKSITTGEGGLLVTNNNTIANKIRSLRNHGISISNKKYVFDLVGFNYRMTDFQAALGIDQLNYIEKIHNHKKKIAKLYNKFLSHISWVKLPIIEKNKETNFQSYHILLDKNIKRDKLIKYLYRHKIETNYGAQAIHIQKYFKNKYKFENNSFPNSYYAYKKGLVLPIGLHVTENDVKKIAKKLESFL
ncbi:MAG: glutamine--scyllo-inositol aminotransferase [Parcubacteria group bacterium]|jgi:dTDP-4-amino-4,6-dideoxygalactose transaminase|nr:glutamine--scyllo-inositol aminotransferase [Parcubacteria group bacterium]